MLAPYITCTRLAPQLDTAHTWHSTSMHDRLQVTYDIMHKRLRAGGFKLDLHYFSLSKGLFQGRVWAAARLIPLPPGTGTSRLLSFTKF